MNQERSFRCYYKTSKEGDLRQEVVKAHSEKDALDLVRSVGIDPISIEEVTEAGNLRRSSSAPYEQRPQSDPRGDIKRPSHPLATFLRIIGGLILLAITLLVNGAGYTVDAWIIGAAVLILIVGPMVYFAEKLDERK